MWNIYIIKLKNGLLYTGMTNDLKRRLKEHQTGFQSKTTHKTGIDTFLYSEPFDNKEDAAKRERQIKGWTRAKKLALISGDFEKLKQLSKKNRIDF